MRSSRLKEVGGVAGSQRDKPEAFKIAPGAVRPANSMLAARCVSDRLKKNTKPLTAAICVLLHGGHGIV